MANGMTETVLVASGGCGACGETFREGDEIAEIYDPNSYDDTFETYERDIVHADCIPNGWQIS
jgi:hypothetical protein